MNKHITLAELIETDELLSIADLCRLCGVSAEWVIELMDEGIVEPAAPEPAAPRFTAVALHRVQIVRRLQRDLGVNRAGAGLALDLLEEIRDLRRRVNRLESQFPGM